MRGPARSEDSRCPLLQSRPLNRPGFPETPFLVGTCSPECSRPRRTPRPIREPAQKAHNRASCVVHRLSSNPCNSLIRCGAEGWTRTSTPLREGDFKSPASTIPPLRRTGAVYRALSDLEGQAFATRIAARRTGVHLGVHSDKDLTAHRLSARGQLIWFPENPVRFSLPVRALASPSTELLDAGRSCYDSTGASSNQRKGVIRS